MMIVVLYGGDLASSETARALYWAAEYKSIQADRAFGRIKRAERLRSLARLLGFGSTKIVDEAEMDAEWTGVGRSGRTMVSIDTIVGAVDPRNGTFGPLPALKRRWKENWRRLWAEDDLDALPALPVVRGVDGWYLTDLPRSVLVLEILRAKGAREARIVNAVEVPDSDASRVQSGEAAASYSLVECERTYDCCEHEESKAV
jgi:hypothetical protein